MSTQLPKIIVWFFKIAIWAITFGKLLCQVFAKD